MLKSFLMIAFGFCLGFAAAYILQGEPPQEIVAYQIEKPESALEGLIRQDKNHQQVMANEPEPENNQVTSEIRIIKTIENNKAQQGKTPLNIETIVTTNGPTAGEINDQKLLSNPVSSAIDKASQEVANLEIFQRKIRCTDDACEVTIDLQGNEEQFIDAYTKNIESSTWRLLKVNVTQSAISKLVIMEVHKTPPQ